MKDSFDDVLAEVHNLVTRIVGRGFLLARRHNPPVGKKLEAEIARFHELSNDLRRLYHEAARRG